MREPYAMPSADEMQRFTAGLLALGVSEIDGQAHHAGVALRHPVSSSGGLVEELGSSMAGVVALLVGQARQQDRIHARASTRIAWGWSHPRARARL